MTIERAEVEHVAMLARLELDSDEIERMTAQLDTILTYMGTLDELGTLDPIEVPPTSHAVALDCPLRPDEPRASGLDDALLERAPERDDRCVAVPRVLE